MTLHDPRKEIEAISRLLVDLFEIAAVYRQQGRLVFNLLYRRAPDRSRALIKDRLTTSGYTFDLKEHANSVVLEIDPRRRLRIPALNIVLFAATILSVYLVPVILRFGESLDSVITAFRAGAGVQFTVALISILFVHEMAHFAAGRRRQIVTSWPYFIPAPSLIGTFGAVIKSKSPFWNRRDLIEVGSAGPIAGWLVALLWLVFGLSDSAISPAEAGKLGEIPFSLEGESIIMRLASLTIVGGAGEGHVYNLTEAAFAGWVGMLITAINLLPIGQLDGGHIVYGLAPTYQRRLGQLAVGLLIVLGLFAVMWWVLAGLVALVRVAHPPTLDDSRLPGRGAVAAGRLSMFIFVVSFTPVPFRAPVWELLAM